MLRMITALALVVAAAAGAAELSMADYEGQMATKNSFVKFLAPW